MAKATDLAKTEETTALVVPEALQGGALIEGTSRGPTLSRMAVFQGTAEEDAMYPGHTLKRGDFFDTLEVRRIGPSVKMVPIVGWVSWARFEKGSKIPVYSTTKRSEVPPEDLQWQENEPPAATESTNLVVVVDGEPWPYLFVFKRTGLEAFNKCIGPMEGRRGSMKKGPGLYELGTKDDKNPSGQSYKRLTARLIGDPTSELLAVATTVHAGMAELRKKAEDMANDNIPI